MTKFRTIIVAGSVALAFAGLALSSAVSHAAVINTLFQPGVNTMQDSDAERVLRVVDGVTTSITSGAFAVGDVIEAILRFDSVNSNTIGDTLGPPYQLTAYAQLQIELITDLGGGVVRLDFGDSGALGTDVLVELYERTSFLQPTFTAAAAPATGIANVQGQTLIAELGLNNIDDFWASIQTNDIAAVAAGSGQTGAGVFGISVITNDGGLPIITNGILSPVSSELHDVIGDASVFARETGVNPGWLVSSNINASFSVPEPGTLGLLGLALAGLGALGRRRKS